MSATGAYRSIILRWTNPFDVDLARVQVWVSLTNDRAVATLVDTPSASPGMQQRWAHTGREPGVTTYYWIRPQDYSGNLSANYTPVSPTSGWGAAATAVPGDDVIMGLRVVPMTDAATVTPDADTTDVGTLATLSQATNFANPAGAPMNGQELVLRILSSTARALTWGAQYRATTGFTLPASTSGGSIPDYVVLRWHSADSKWDCTLQTTASMGVSAASETVAGKAELATQVETDAGVDDLRIVTPLKLAAATTVAHPTVFVVVAGTSEDMLTDSDTPGGYIADNAALVSLRLPLVSAIGDLLFICGKGAGGWRVTQRTSQQIHLGAGQTTVGTGGVLTAPNQFSALVLRCITANTIWEVTGGVA